MNKKLFVANIPFSLDEEELKQVFEIIGTVISAKIVKDKYTGRSRGFGFVEMSTAEECSEAKTKLNGHEVQGKELKVDEAKDNRAPGSGGGYGGGHRSGGGRSEGGYGGGGHRGGRNDRGDRGDRGGNRY